MQWLAALLIGAVSNLDNLGVGIAFGIRGTRIGAMANLIVAAITMAATAMAMAGGQALSELLPPGVTGWLGPLIIIAIGIATVLTSAQAPRTLDRHAPLGVGRHPDRVGKTISRREAMLLGVALSLNNLGTGIGAGIAGIPASATILAAGLLSLACVGGGFHAGRAVGRLVLGRYAPLIAGILLMAVGAATLPGVR